MFKQFLTFFLAIWGIMPIAASESKLLPTVIILLGPPGSGKGTQAVDLSRVKEIPHISTGDLFRDNLKSGTPLGLEAKQYLDKGQLVPDSLVLDILFERVSQPDCTKGYILDGVPRNITQTHELEDYFRNKANLIVVNFAVPDEAVIKRLSGRLVCKKCNKVYHAETSPPKQQGVCDVCSGEVYQRSDDKPEVIKERLKIYHAQTQPLEKYYKEKNILIEIDASRPKEEVFVELQKACP